MWRWIGSDLTSQIEHKRSKLRRRSLLLQNYFLEYLKVLFWVPSYSPCIPLLQLTLHEKHGLSVHLYADDTQIYIMFNQDDTVNALSRIEACVAEIQSWMITNKLMLNGDKTLIIVLSAPRHSVSCNVNHGNIDGHEIVPAKTVKILGVIFYDKLSLDSHIKNICKTSLYHLKNISNIRSFLLDKAAVQLTHAFVSSRLDYCNSLLQGLPSCSISPYKILQHTSSRGRVNINT